MAYATATDLAQHFDVGLIGRLASDENAELTVKDILDHPNVAKALDAASGRVLSALLRGARYKVEDLDALTTHSKQHIARITSILAMCILMGRRPGSHEREREFMKNESEEFLRALADGKDCLDLEPQIAAGLINAHKVDVPTMLTQDSLISQKLEGHLFGRR